MPKRTPSFFKLILTLLALLLPIAAGSSIASGQEKVLVFAAASLKDALDETAGAWEKAGGAPVSISYAGSSALARQIEEGAPADLFISADRDWMDHLAGRGLVRPESRVEFLGNRLALIAPASSNAAAVVAPGFPLADLLGDGRLAIADTDAVPAGKYARAALEALGVWRSVSKKTAEAENVRAALALVSLGEAPLGIVYETDAAADPRVRIVARFDPALHPPIVYPAAVLTDGPMPEAAGAFLDFLRSAEATHIFAGWGFTPLAAGTP